MTQISQEIQQALFARSQGILTQDIIKKRVLIVGTGSVGSYLAEILTRSGVGAFTLVTFIINPNYQEIHDYLFDQKYDILFFAGHSESNIDQNTGFFYINEEEKISVSSFRNVLKKAIENGLKIAIFNSCDGLGLGNELTKLNLPISIVMRDAIPDQVAQEFLENFLNAYAGGKSFYLAVKEAKEKLQGLEHIYPYVSWLPIICQNPAEIPPTWDDLRGN